MFFNETEIGLEKQREWAQSRFLLFFYGNDEPLAGFV